MSKGNSRTLSTFTASATISGPMPSPGRIAIFTLSTSLCLGRALDERLLADLEQHVEGGGSVTRKDQLGHLHQHAFAHRVPTVHQKELPRRLEDVQQVQRGDAEQHEAHPQ